MPVARCDRLVTMVTLRADYSGQNRFKIESTPARFEKSVLLRLRTELARRD